MALQKKGILMIRSDSPESPEFNATELDSAVHNFCKTFQLPLGWTKALSTVKAKDLAFPVVDLPELHLHTPIEQMARRCVNDI